jgi:archaellum component FlaC
MVTNEEFGQLVSEFESLRDLIMDEFGKIKTEIENLSEDLNELKSELMESSKIISKKRLG